MHARHKECKAATKQHAEQRVAQAAPPSGLRVPTQPLTCGLRLAHRGARKLLRLACGK